MATPFPLPSDKSEYVTAERRPSPDLYRWLKQLVRTDDLPPDPVFSIITNDAGSPIVARTLGAVWRDLPSILDFGFVTGGADNAAAFVAMRTYCLANGIAAAIVPGGDYTFSTYPNVSLPFSLIGAGNGLARFLRNYSGTTDQGLFEPASGVFIRDIAVVGGAAGSNIVVKSAAAGVVLSGLDLGGTTTNGLRVNSASRLSVSDCRITGGDVSIASLADSCLSFSRTGAMALASVSGLDINVGQINGNLSIDSGSSNSRVRAGTLSGTLTNSSTTCNVEEGLTGSRRGNSTDGVQFLPNRRVRKWMSNAINTSFATFTWATNLGGNDVPFTATPDIVGFYNSGASTAGAGWQNVTTTTVEIRGSASNAVRIVAEGSY